VAGTVLNSGDLPWRARLLLPGVFATMHFSWGLGFLSSPRSLRSVR
jgi:hypothetical protein